MRYALYSAVVASLGVAFMAAGVPTSGNVTAHADEQQAPVADERQIRDTLRLLGPRFQRTETRHFVILSDCSPSWTRSRGTLLERTRDQYFRMTDKLEISVRPHDHKLLCVLFDDPRQYASFARTHDGLAAGWVAGYYATGTNRIVFYNDENSPDLLQALAQLDDYERQAESRRSKARDVGRGDRDLADRLLASADEIDVKISAERSRLTRHTHDVAVAKAIHEAVHLLAFNTGLQSADRDYPFWLCEGLATTFETDAPDAAFGPGHVSEARRQKVQAIVAQGGLIPFEQLVTRSSAPSDDARTADAMYQLSYALFAYLYRHERRALGAYLKAFQALPPGPLSERKQLELFKAHFGAPGRLQRRVIASIQDD